RRAPRQPRPCAPAGRRLRPAARPSRPRPIRPPSRARRGSPPRRRARRGRGAGLLLALEALAALLERLPAALEVHEVRLLELQPAFGLHELAARLVEALLAGAGGLIA